MNAADGSGAVNITNTPDDRRGLPGLVAGRDQDRLLA